MCCLFLMTQTFTAQFPQSPKTAFWTILTVSMMMAPMWGLILLGLVINPLSLQKYITHFSTAQTFFMLISSLLIPLLTILWILSKQKPNQISFNERGITFDLKTISTKHTEKFIAWKEIIKFFDSYKYQGFYQQYDRPLPTNSIYISTKEQKYAFGLNVYVLGEYGDEILDHLFEYIRAHHPEIELDLKMNYKEMYRGKRISLKFGQIVSQIGLFIVSAMVVFACLQ
jgi:hypothetical protein